MSPVEPNKNSHPIRGDGRNVSSGPWVRARLFRGPHFSSGLPPMVLEKWTAPDRPKCYTLKVFKKELPPTISKPGTNPNPPGVSPPR